MMNAGLIHERLRRQTGFIASYILYGIALMGIVGLAYGKIYFTNEQAKIIQDTVEELNAQVEVIRGKVLLCGAIYPDGDHGQFNARHAYPAPPNAQANRDALNNVTCPGSPGGALHLGQLSDGVPLPQVTQEFNPWIYEHTDAAGIRLILSPKVAGGGAQVRQRLLRQLGSLASASGDDVVISILQ
ncbi:MAG TPA: hypothetical protein VGE55_02125 [Limnobacter sp.]|uniref:hypothetical protein n=1 Tax=Limnobacter sp. TaxID=2003368 RepID=UPI002EDA8C68